MSCFASEINQRNKGWKERKASIWLVFMCGALKTFVCVCACVCGDILSRKFVIKRSALGGTMASVGVGIFMVLRIRKGRNTESWRWLQGLQEGLQDRRILSHVSTAQKPPHLYSTVQQQDESCQQTRKFCCFDRTRVFSFDTKAREEQMRLLGINDIIFPKVGIIIFLYKGTRSSREH
jgi:hypothetical protein